MSLKVVRPTYRNVDVAVDADIVAFRAAYIGEEGKHVGLAMSVVADMLDTIATNLNVGIDSLILCFSGNDNYRHLIADDYKANRKGKPKPRYLDEVVQLAQQKYRSRVVSYLEADDIVCSGDIIASVDKDLLQIPGLHYDLTKQVVRRVSDVEADNYLLRQAITGDSTDNIRGIRGMGPKKADKYIETLDPHTTLEEKLTEISKLYVENGYSVADFLRCLNSVYVQRDHVLSLFSKDSSGIFLADCRFRDDTSKLVKYNEKLV